MKKCALSMLVLMLCPLLVYADTITNNNGIVISEEEYNNFSKVYSDAYLMTMTEEQYARLKTYDYNNVKTEKKYILSTYNPRLMLTTEKEITKEEYDNFKEPEVMPLLNSDGAYVESAAKELTLNLIGGTTINNIIAGATWKGIPKTRSFDVIGFRGFDFDFVYGSQYGEQIYVKNGKFETITYAWNHGNVKRLDNGFGISMNIVNDDITYLQLIAEAEVAPTSAYPAIYASYQHAIASVSLANSQNYTMGGSGLGGVFIYPYSISQKYDGMTGVYLQY